MSVFIGMVVDGISDVIYKDWTKYWTKYFAVQIQV